MDRTELAVKDYMPGVSDKVHLSGMLRVDHAGEFGAVQIYRGQLVILRKHSSTTASAQIIDQMATQEQRHLETFDQLLLEHQVRPTLLAPLWHVAGFALGAATALISEKAAMACTAAVEEVIDEHYAAQSKSLARKGRSELQKIVDDFRADEEQHRQIALEEGAEETPFYGALTNAIKAGCRMAIKLSEKI